MLEFGMLLVGKALFDAFETRNVQTKATDILRGAQKGIEKERNVCVSNLNKLGKKKLNLLSFSIQHFVNSFGKIKKVEFQTSKEIFESNKLCFTAAEFDDFKELSEMSLSLDRSDQLISYLALCGGISSLPILAGIVVGKKSSALKNQAKSNLAMAKKQSSEIMASIDLYRNISRKSTMFIQLLNKLDEYLTPLVNRIDEIINSSGTDFSTFNKEQKQCVAGAACLAKAIKVVIDTPIINSKGNINPECDSVVALIKPEALVQGDSSSLIRPDFKKEVKKEVQQKRELGINQIVFACESYVFNRRNTYSNENEEWANIDWKKLDELVRESYGLETFPDEYRAIIPEFGSKTAICLGVLRQELKEFVFFKQISYILSKYRLTDDSNLREKDVDWDLFVESLNKIYGVEFDKWQLCIPGKNTVSDLITRISHVVYAKTALNYDMPYTTSKFHRLINE